MNTQVNRYAEVRDKILRATDTLADPIRETISPKGRNVIYVDRNGNVMSTNDGITIAKHISLKDPVEDAVVELIKSSSMKTNNEVGDGTSTSILLSQILIKEGFRLVDNGHNPMEVKAAFQKFGDDVVAELKKQAVQVKDDKDLESIATISANNDRVIAKDIVRVVKTAGLDGMVFIEPNNKPETEIIEETGFIVQTSIYQELITNKTKFSSAYSKVPVLITDKRLYYPEEAETILKTVLEAGHKAVVIVARDFIGQFPNYMIANHAQGVCNVLMVRDPKVSERDSETLYDLAAYLGGTVISEKTGRIVDNMTIDDFVICDKVFADPVKTIITTAQKTKALKDRITAIREELKQSKDNESLKKRLASLTNGMVTLKVGGATQVEVMEKIFRYEDAVNATRAAMRDGYLIGGGIALKNAFESLKKDYGEYTRVFKRYCEGNIRQIAENCGLHPDTVVGRIEAESKNIGYNALTGEFEDLIKAGVIDPYKVTEMAVRNSISVVAQLISANFIITHEPDNGPEEDA